MSNYDSGSDYDCGYSDDEWSPPPSKAATTRPTKPLWLPPLSAANSCVLWLQFDPKYKEYYAADPSTGRFYENDETLALISQIMAQDEANEEAKRQKQHRGWLQTMKALSDVAPNIVVTTAPNAPRADPENVVVHTMVSDTLFANIPTTVSPLKETVEAEMSTVKPVEERKKKEPQTRKPKAKRVKSSSSAKSKSTKQKQQQQRAKESPPQDHYSFSASIRRFREEQLWFGVDPYSDRKQSLYQLLRDMTKPPKLIQ